MNEETRKQLEETMRARIRKEKKQPPTGGWLEYYALVREVRKLGACIPCNTGGTFEHDPLDAILDAARREIEAQAEACRRVAEENVMLQLEVRTWRSSDRGSDAKVAAALARCEKAETALATLQAESNQLREDTCARIDNAENCLLRIRLSAAAVATNSPDDAARNAGRSIIVLCEQALEGVNRAGLAAKEAP